MSRKLITFDLNTSLLKEYYNKSYTNAYYEIREYMEKNGYEHRQGSVYISKESVSLQDALLYLQDMMNHFNWLEVCANKMDIANLSKQYDVLEMINSINKENRFEQQKDIDKSFDIEEHDK